ncbi:MAG: 2OG-Fe(II) oxygenase, partial [Phenylobacterium sp.]
MSVADLLSPLPPLSVGEFAPWFSAPAPNHPDFNFNTSAGRYVLLAFLPPPGAARDRAMAAFDARAHLFDDRKLTCFMVLRDAASIAAAQNRDRGLRWFFDPEGKVSRLYGALTPQGTEAPFWLLLDPFLRVLDSVPIGEEIRIFKEIEALPEVSEHAGAPLYAPVLIAPRIFEPEMCKRLIAYYDADGGAPSGVMRDVDGKTVGVLDDFKRRRDVTITDEDLRRDVLVRLRRRLLPEIKRVFQFEATRLERYLVAAYDAADGGYFRPHRDNESLATAHRRFAVSIN